MALESGSFIPELDDNNPLGADAVSAGDDHIRLLKRCVTGSFPAFVGTAAAPKSVTLTEDQLNDAALKSETQTISAAWSFNAPVTIDAAGVLQLIIKESGVDKFWFSDEIMYWGPNVNSTGTGSLGSIDSTNPYINATTKMTHRVANVGVAEAVGWADGSLLVADIGGTHKKAGFRNPSPVTVANDRDAAQSDEGTSISGGNNMTLTLVQLETGTTFRRVQRGGSGFLAEGAGVTITHLGATGGVPVTGNFEMARGSVVEIYYRSPTDVEIFGNGVTVVP